jgi:hypothetical protein
MGIMKRTSITGSVRCVDEESVEINSASILLEVSSEGNYSVSPDLAKSLFGNVMAAVLRGNMQNRTVSAAEQVVTKPVKIMETGTDKK